MPTVVDLSGNNPGPEPSLSGSHDLQALKWTGVEHNITIGAASVQTAPFQYKCRAIRIAPVADIYWKVGANPTAVKLTSKFLGGGAVETVRVVGNQRIAIIQSLATTGNCTISEDI